MQSMLCKFFIDMHAKCIDFYFVFTLGELRSPLNFKNVKI